MRENHEYSLLLLLKKHRFEYIRLVEDEISLANRKEHAVTSTNMLSMDEGQTSLEQKKPIYYQLDQPLSMRIPRKHVCWSMSGKIRWDQQGTRNQAISLLTWGKSEALLIMQAWRDEVIFFPPVLSAHLRALGHLAALKRNRGPKIHSDVLSRLVFQVNNPEIWTHSRSGAFLQRQTKHNCVVNLSRPENRCYECETLVINKQTKK